MLDYVLVCKSMEAFLQTMKIDDARMNTLTKYSSKKGIQKKVMSDHNLLYVSFNLKTKTRTNNERKTLFNFRSFRPGPILVLLRLPFKLVQ